MSKSYRPKKANLFKYFGNIFISQFINLSSHYLSTVNVKSNGPKKLISFRYLSNFLFINPSCRYLSTVNVKSYRPEMLNVNSNILGIFLAHNSSTPLPIIYQR